MFRHILMTPPVEAQRSIPRPLEQLVQRVARPLYAYAVPHRTLRPHELPHFCTCRYPVYTLCTPKPSPYNTAENSDVVPVAQPSMMPLNGAALHNTRDEHGQSSRAPPSLSQGASTFDSAVRSDDGEEAGGSREQEMCASNNSSCSGAVAKCWRRPQRMRSRTLKLWRLWRRGRVGQQTASSSSANYTRGSSSSNILSYSSSNVIPALAHPYFRCDICDCLCRTHSTTAEPSDVRLSSRWGNMLTHRRCRCPPRRRITALPNDTGEANPESAHSDLHVRSRSVRAADVGDAAMSVPADVLSASMRDIDVAQLRYLDPFCVEVAGRPPLTALTRNFVRQFFAQLRRCNVKVRDLLWRYRNVQHNSIRHSRGYDVWVQQERQRVAATFALPVKVHPSYGGRNSSSSSSSSITLSCGVRADHCGLADHAQATCSSSASHTNKGTCQTHRAQDEQTSNTRPSSDAADIGIGDVTSTSNCNKDDVELSRGTLLAHIRDTTELLDRAAYAVRFAVAAYGLPYELGYFNDLKGLVCLQSEPHCRYAWATASEQMDSMRRVLQGGAEQPLWEFTLCRYSLSLNQPSFVVMLDHSEKLIVVTFRGTLTLADAVVDVMEGYVTVDLQHDSSMTPHTDGDGSNRSNNEQTGRKQARAVPGDVVHGDRQEDQPGESNVAGQGSISPTDDDSNCNKRNSEDHHDPSRHGKCSDVTSAGGESRHTTGHASSAQLRRDTQEEASAMCTRVPVGFYESVRDAAAQLIPALRCIHARHKDYDLLVTGHSLGAIQATLFHLLYCLPTRESTQSAVGFARVMTFAFAPAPVIEERVVPALNDLLRRVRAETGSRLVSFSHGYDAVPRMHVRSVLDSFLTRDRIAHPSTKMAAEGGRNAATTSVATATAVSSGAQSGTKDTKASPAFSAGKRTEASSAAGAMCDQGECASSSSQCSTNSAPYAMPGSSGRSNKNAHDTLYSRYVRGEESNRGLTVSDEVVPSLAIPGEFYTCPHTLTRHLLRVPLSAPWRRQLILSAESAIHHFPTLYVRAINRLLVHYSQRWNELSNAQTTATTTTMDGDKNSTDESTGQKF